MILKLKPIKAQEFNHNTAALDSKSIPYRGQLNNLILLKKKTFPIKTIKFTFSKIKSHM